MFTLQAFLSGRSVTTIIHKLQTRSQALQLVADLQSCPQIDLIECWSVATKEDADSGWHVSQYHIAWERTVLGWLRIDQNASDDLLHLCADCIKELNNAPLDEQPVTATKLITWHACEGFECDNQASHVCQFATDVEVAS